MRKCERVANEPWRRHLRHDGTSDGHRAVWKRHRREDRREGEDQRREAEETPR